jgi:hypothetical protein
MTELGMRGRVESPDAVSEGYGHVNRRAPGAK